MRLVCFLLFCVIFGISNSEAFSLCTDKDEVYFSCRTKDLKTLSLCGKREGGVYYRFGKPKKIEFEYPGDNVGNKDSLSLFAYNSYNRWMVSYFTVTFHNHGYTYIIQDLRNAEDEVEHNIQNIAIYSKPDQTDDEKIISCASDMISNLRPLMYIIPCNEGMALGCDKNDGYLDLGITQ